MNKINTETDFLKLLRSKSISFNKSLEIAENELNILNSRHTSVCGFTDSGTHYHRHGNPQSPNKIIFIHAMGGNLHNWLAVTSYLRDQCDVYVVDLPWHGQTNFKKGITETYTALHFRWLNEFITQLSLTKITIVGHSLGARIGTIYAASNPGTVNALIALTPAYSPALGGLVAMESSIIKMLATKYGKIIDREVLQLFLYEMLISKQKDTLTGLNYAVREMVRDQSPTEMQGILNALRWFKDEPFDFEIITELADKIPVTILCGQKDIYCPNRELIDMKAARLEVQIIKRSGHLLPLERPLICANRILATINKIEP